MVYSRNGDMLARMEQNILAVIGDNGDRLSYARLNFESLNDEEACLKTQLDDMQSKAKLSEEKKYALMAVGEELRRHDCHLAEYDDRLSCVQTTVRKVIEVIRVLSKTEVGNCYAITIIFKDGHEMNVAVEK